MRKYRLGVAGLAMTIVTACFVSDTRACTSIMVGRKASADGSVMTSHTCDSHDGSSAIRVVPARKHERGEQVVLTKRRGGQHAGR